MKYARSCCIYEFVRKSRKKIINSKVKIFKNRFSRMRVIVLKYDLKFEIEIFETNERFSFIMEFTRIERTIPKISKIIDSLRHSDELFFKKNKIREVKNDKKC